MKNIEIMHSMFGELPEHKCGECSNLHKRTYSNVCWKCEVFGSSSSESSDFRKKWTACGMFCKEYTGTPIKDYVKHTPKAKDDVQIEGQMELFDANL